MYISLVRVFSVLPPCVGYVNLVWGCPGVMYCTWNGSDSIAVLGFVYYVWDRFRLVVRVTYM